MNDIVKTETYKGHKIEIWWDECADYSDTDRLGTFYTNIPRELNPDNKEIDEAFEDGIFDDGLHIREDLIYVKVWAIIHSGVYLSTTRSGCFCDPWDSGLGGIMAVTREKARKWCRADATDDEIREQLEYDVEELNHFCQGEVYGYTIYDKDGTEEDSVGYYVGDIDYCFESAKGMVDADEQFEYETKFKESLMYAEAE